MSDTPQKQPSETPTATSNGIPIMAIVSGVISFIFIFIYNYGAAKLSYSRYGSIGWSILAFFFSGLYYPYFAFFVNTAQPIAVMGGRKLRR
jgi:hypothetical protein